MEWYRSVLQSTRETVRKRSRSWVGKGSACPKQLNWFPSPCSLNWLSRQSAVFNRSTMSRQPELSYGLTWIGTKRQRNLTAATRILSLVTDTHTNLASSQTIWSSHRRENLHTMTRSKTPKYWTQASLLGQVRSIRSATNTSVFLNHCSHRLKTPKSIA